jgi:hypothetical protein
MYRGMLSYLAARTRRSEQELLESVAEPDLRRFLRQPFLVSGWYDVLPFTELATVGASAIGTTLAQLARDQSKHQAKEDISGVYRLLMRFTPMDVVVSALPRFAQKYFDFGAYTSQRIGERHYRILRSGIPESFAFYHSIAGAMYSHTACETSSAYRIQHSIGELESDGSAHGMRLKRFQIEMQWEERDRTRRADGT